MDNTWAVFTKPWRQLSTSELADLVARMGFSGAELPARSGYQIEPNHVDRDMASVVKEFSARNLDITSVAAAPTEAVIAACGDHGIRMIRTMVPISENGYTETGEEIRRLFDRVVTVAEKHRVRIGIQPHFDYYVSDSSELHCLLKDYSSTVICAIWDAAHDALARKAPEHGLTRIWDRLGMVNLKNAVMARDPKSHDSWEPQFVRGDVGFASWRRIGDFLTLMDYNGPICLTAEYTDATSLERDVIADLAFAKQCFGQSPLNEESYNG